MQQILSGVNNNMATIFSSSTLAQPAGPDSKPTVDLSSPTSPRARQNRIGEERGRGSIYSGLGSRPKAKEEPQEKSWWQNFKDIWTDSGGEDNENINDPSQPKTTISAGTDDSYDDGSSIYDSDVFKVKPLPTLPPITTESLPPDMESGPYSARQDAAATIRRMQMQEYLDSVEEEQAKTELDTPEFIVEPTKAGEERGREGTYGRGLMSPPIRALEDDEKVRESLRPKARPKTIEEEAEPETAFLENAIDKMLVTEGDYQNDKADTGNYTKPNGNVVGTMRGITPYTWAAWSGKSVSEVTEEEMKAITEEEAREIYKEVYWKKPKISQLPTNLQETVFDMQLNSGINAIKILQELAGLDAKDVDGFIGPVTLAAVNDANITADQYADARIAYYKKIAENSADKDGDNVPDKMRYLRGWIARANKYRD